jgi:NAD-dependent SIR2 family protein deacetylase
MNAYDSQPSELSAAALFGIDYAREQLAGKKIAVLTGAGMSTDSGIPDYRGQGKTPKHPMTFDLFMGSHAAQQRYWARSFVGWSRIATAKPNEGHFALALAEQSGTVQSIITQNVDGLHTAAGSKHVYELHGRLDLVKCMGCGAQYQRELVDTMLQELNPTVARDQRIEFTPDGDAEIEATADFVIPQCPKCHGVLKPDVVFFGESVDAPLVERCMAQVDSSHALLVAGTSLQVNSGMRFVRRALKANHPVIIVNLGPTKADEFALAKIEANTSLALGRLLND